MIVVLGSAAVVLRRQRLWPFEMRLRAPGNLVLVTLDTTRADHLSCYGYSARTTPNLDRLAQTGVLFEHADSVAPLTLPAHTSMLTGLYPYNHGVRNNGDFYLPPDVPTLATLLKRQGYRTAAFISAFVLDSRYGLAQGFDVYEDRLEGKERALQDFDVERKGGQTMQLALQWLESNASKPFFLWVHLYDPHESYDPPQPFREEFTSLYDGEIAYADSLVAELDASLEDRGIRDRTLLVIAGDHGESLGEHEEETHSIFVYGATVRVPVMFSMPGGMPEGLRVEAPVSLVDLFSTIVEMMNIPGAPQTDGRSLVPLMRRPRAGAEPAWRDRPLYCESLFPKLYLRWAPLRAVEAGQWKYIESPRPELYRIDNDPGETLNLLASSPGVAAEMKTKLASFAAAGGTERFHRAALDDETIAKLAGLGYVAAAAYAGSPVESVGDTDLPDPKDKIAFFNRIREAQKQIRGRRFETAIPMLERVVASEPDNAVALLFLANGYLGMEDYGRAIATYRRYLELVPQSAYAHHWIAIAAVRLGDRERALAEEEAAIAIDRRFVDSYVMKGGVLASMGRYAEAVKALTEAVEIDPDNAGLMNDLGAVYMEWGKLREAEETFLAITRLDPKYAPAYTSLGIIRVALGDPEHAIDYFNRALAISPVQNEARFNLAKALLSLRRVDEARRQLALLLEQTKGARNQRVLAIRGAAEELLAQLSG
ncbi:MAG: sulfatase-like hydrolase/transferase [Acidobacteriota bacterium]